MIFINKTHLSSGTVNDRILLRVLVMDQNLSQQELLLKRLWDFVIVFECWEYKFLVRRSCY
jgi:hypothetical protein